MCIRDSTGTIQNHLDILHLAVCQMKRVYQTCRRNYGGAMLIIMKYRNIHNFAQALLDNETFGGFDILKINAAKRWPHQLDRSDKFIHLFCVNFKIDAINIGKFFEQNRLAPITGFEAAAPILPSPSTAVPLEITATILPLAV